MSFFAGNDKTILIKKQADKDTPVTDWSNARAFRVYEWTKNPVRVQGPLNESDRSVQQGGTHVTAIGPGFSFGVYGRPTELALLAEALLGDNDNSATSSPTTHTATPVVESPYYSVAEVDDFEFTVYDGCRMSAATFQAQDSGETELRVTGITWEALGVTHGGTAPSPMPAFVDELPFIYAEAAISYAAVHPGTTTAFSVTVNRNATRAQGDNGFRATDIVNGKFQVDGSFTRYVQDADTMRAVDTGAEAGTVPTSDIFTEAASILFQRGSAGTLRQFLIALAEIAYETREQALNLDGTPLVEVLGFRTQPQADLVDHMSIVTVNAIATAV